MKPTPEDIEQIKRQACGIKSVALDQAGFDKTLAWHRENSYDFNPQTEEWSEKPVEKKWPLTGEIGIQVYQIAGSAVTFPGSYVKADDLERLLEKGVSLKQCYQKNSDGKWVMFESDVKGNPLGDPQRYTALAINIQPIKQPDTAENLLKEWIDWYQSSKVGDSFLPILDRAKALLEKSEGGK